MTKWRVSSAKNAGQIVLDEQGYIAVCPAVWRRFSGYPVGNLLDWLRKFGAVECIKL